MDHANDGNRVIVFVGPSIPLDLARRVLPNADFRPPIKRGDLDAVSADSVVGIIDGVFAQELAISPREVRDAVARGIAVYGASSMGALRAAEVRGVIGVGRIYEMYRSGALERDDEVALIFDPESHVALTVPLANVRYAVGRLVRSATLDAAIGDAILLAAASIHYTERTYPNILRRAGLSGSINAQAIAQLLRNFDLKREDAQLLLETVATHKPSAPSVIEQRAVETFADYESPEFRVRERESTDATIMVWEYGDTLALADLLQFTKVTGRFDDLARRVLGRFAVARTPLPCDKDVSDDSRDAQWLLDFTRMVWGWETPEEAHVTMRDFGIGLEDAAESLEAELTLRTEISRFATSSDEVFRRAMRVELWLNDLVLKRESLRLGSLRFFARRGRASGEPTTEELDSARRCVCRLRRVMRWADARAELVDLGVTEPEIESFVEDIALARRSGKAIIEILDRPFRGPRDVVPRASQWRALGLDAVSCKKAPGSLRFSTTETAALENATRVAEKMGILRIGLIGQLDNLGIHVAQAFGDRSGWSSSFSSGKSETEEGAKVGSIMEEAEIHAQDAFRVTTELQASFARVSTNGSEIFIDPQTLDLPYDSRYSPELEIGWAPAIDLIGCQRVFVPSAALISERVTNDIFYSARLGAKQFSSSGLGSGFSLAEAIVHASAEYIERHAWRLAELQIDNPAGVGGRRFYFVDNSTLPAGPRRLVDKFERAGMIVRILDITSEIAIPTFAVRLFEDPFCNESSLSCDGYACHPNPAVAITMALLEAGQTKAGAIAGGREDYALKARSLGRHERPRTVQPASQVFWYGSDQPTRVFDEVPGFRSDDLLDELEWMVQRVKDAAYRHFLVVDYTPERIRPAFAVRALIPGAESTNPFYVGERARAMSVRDLLPAV